MASGWASNDGSAQFSDGTVQGSTASRRCFRCGYLHSGTFACPVGETPMTNERYTCLKTVGLDRRGCGLVFGSWGELKEHEKTHERLPLPWRFESRNVAIADTGDYDGVIEIRASNDNVVAEAWNANDEQEAAFRQIVEEMNSRRAVEPSEGYSQAYADQMREALLRISQPVFVNSKPMLTDVDNVKAIRDGLNERITLAQAALLGSPQKSSANHAVTYDVVAYNESWGGYGDNASKEGFETPEAAITYAKSCGAHLNATVWKRIKPLPTEWVSTQIYPAERTTGDPC